jgi:hypothetical protein
MNSPALRTIRRPGLGIASSGGVAGAPFDPASSATLLRGSPSSVNHGDVLRSRASLHWRGSDRSSLPKRYLNATVAASSSR